MCQNFLANLGEKAKTIGDAMMRADGFLGYYEVRINSAWGVVIASG